MVRPRVEPVARLLGQPQPPRDLALEVAEHGRLPERGEPGPEPLLARVHLHRRLSGQIDADGLERDHHEGFALDVDRPALSLRDQLVGEVHEVERWLSWSVGLRLEAEGDPIHAIPRVELHADEVGEVGGVALVRPSARGPGQLTRTGVLGSLGLLGRRWRGGFGRPLPTRGSQKDHGQDYGRTPSHHLEV
jgi:hypothetical protein